MDLSRHSFGVFQMMSGSVLPSSVGLIDKRDIKRLLKYKVLFKLLTIQMNCASLLIGSATLSFYILNEDLSTVVIYGVPHSLWTGLWLNPIIASFLSQFFYYYIIVTYLKMKINTQINIFIQLETNKNFSRIQLILNKLDSIYREIEEYNRTYWSKFVFINWLYLGAGIMLLIYIVIFGDMIFIIKTLLIYGIIVIYGSLHSIFKTGASLNTAINRSYKQLNSYVTKSSSDSIFVRIGELRLKIKVFK